MTNEDYKKIVDQVPHVPGVYRFIDETDTILYVGKAKDLKKRVSSYFGSRKNQAFKTKTMVRNARRIEYTIVETEHDALLLENTLIKKHQPRYNFMLKDGKSYSYIVIKKERFPRVFFTRKVFRDGSTYFGPYTSKYRANILLEIIKKLFPLRTCNYQLSEQNIANGKFKVCLEYHIENCLGPCAGLQDETSYNENIDQVRNILKGHVKPVRDFILRRIDESVGTLDFEKAQAYKEKLEALENYQSKSTVVSTTILDLDVFAIRSEDDLSYVSYLKIVNGALINSDNIELKKNLNDNEKDLLAFSADFIREKFNSVAPEVVVPKKIKLIEDVKITVPQRGDKKSLLDLAEKNLKYFILQKRKSEAEKAKKQTSAERILKTLQSDLDMETLPLHIECFDNSNIQGSDPVASCVVFKNAKPSKKEYRKFNIKTVEGPNDFASMEEVVYRRYKRLLDENEKLPQLVVIDGGKGQLNAAVKSLKRLSIEDEIVIIGIAKRLEEIYFPGDPIPLYINKKSESLKLIQHLRNEAHRFAINFHRDKRSQGFVNSELLEIQGVGQNTADKLLRTFGSVKKISEQPLDILQETTNKTVGKKIHDHFRKKQAAKD